MIRRVAKSALGSRCREVVVVLGIDADVYRPLLNGLGVRIVFNPDPSEGVASSIRTGVQAVSPEAAGVVILLADQPLVTSDVIDAVIAAALSARRPVAASAYAGTLGPPVYFARALFPELLALAGDRGARSVIEAHAAERVEVPLHPDRGTDIDTADDIAMFA
jgi:molybdenum cofactor cytidylyltransferase